ncbi:MAG: hypothetical protein D6788_04775, partial [Planctomycetota bacterium]
MPTGGIEGVEAPCLSLPRALARLMGVSPTSSAFDDLLAAMGLAFLIPAVPDEPDVGRWPLYARDAFLAPAGALFGLTVRDIHPPQVARGLTREEAFRQHFDASYRPFLHEALKHDQPVLAWQGWADEAAMLWGVVTETCDEGAGFGGWVDAGSSAEPRRYVLETPPAQLYVIEAMNPSDPEPETLIDTVSTHMGLLCRDAIFD